MAARAGAADSRDAWLVADKCLIMSGMMIRPVWFCRQAKYSFNLLSACYLPPAVSAEFGANRACRPNRAAAGRSQVLQGLPEIVSGPASKSSLSAICQPREILYFCNRYSIKKLF